jgi:glycosyltransferase involved in cell wall biosynthesis
MKVLLIGNYENDRQESMQRFALLMQRGLAQAGHEVRVRRPPPMAGQLRPFEHGVGKWLGYVDKFAIFPAMLAKDARWADIAHICDHSNAMYTSHLNTRPVVVTCHDMLAVRGALGEDTDCRPTPAGKILQRWIVAGLRRADKLACVSTATSQDVERIVRASGRSLEVIPNGLNYPYSVLPEETARLRLSGTPSIRYRRFLLHVGSNLRRKNREGVVRVFAKVARIVDLDLVLAGSELSPELRDLAQHLGVAEKIIAAASPSEQVLEALYNSAFALFFPSRFEGFGWPLIEAQACGCPIICSRCPPFGEILADTALMRDVDDEEGFAADICGLTRDPQTWNSLRNRGLRNAERFQPETMILAYISLYEDLVRQHH